MPSFKLPAAEKLKNEYKIADSEIDRFRNLFAGLERAYGIYVADEKIVTSNGKISGKAKTIKGSVTRKLWQDHLYGNQGIGIVPIREDGKCLWACIDIDKYRENVKEKVAKYIADNDLPLVVCRSKSNGAHIFAFFSEPVNARTVQKKLASIANDMGFSGSEIFPKQISLRKDEIGNWLNIPFFRAEYSTSYCVTAEKNIVDLTEFLDYAENRRISPDDLYALGSSEAIKSEYGDGPPCINEMIDAKIGEGGRNNACLHFTVYAKDKYGDDWEVALHDFNSTLGIPLTDRELEQTVKKSSKRKDYGYMCAQQPMASFCDRNACKKRKFGINGEINEQVDAAVEELNESYFVVKRGNKVAICEPFTDTAVDRTLYRFLGKDDLNLLFANRRIDKIPISAHWLQAENRCTYEDMVLRPDKDPGPQIDGTFNMWRGWGIESTEGKIPYFDELVNEIICDSNAVLSEWLWGWMARGVQYPHKPAEVAFAMQGGQGTGKSTLARTYGALFGNHFVHAISPDDVIGQFNQHLLDCLFLFNDEALSPANNKQASKMKGMITEPRYHVEAKFVDRKGMLNRLKIMFATNAERVANVEPDDRRFVITRVSDKHKQDLKWFRELHKEINEDGLGVLLWRLQNYDISEFQIRDLPHTAAKERQQDLSLDALDAFWWDELELGSHGDDQFEWKRVPKEVLFDRYNQHRRNRPFRSGPDNIVEFGRQLGKRLPDKWNHAGRPMNWTASREIGKRGNTYKMPKLKVCRDEFAKWLGRNIEWPDESSDKGKDLPPSK